eukprot:10318270-Heterocapsa_arctica.AAC.1
MIKAAGQSRATYGAAVDPFTVAQINTFRGKYTQALWPKKYVARRTVGLLLVDKREIEPGVNVIKTILVNWTRQTEGGLRPSAEEHWDGFKIQT